MNQTRKALLQQLAQFEQENDQRATSREDKLVNITPDTGPFLSLLIKATQARAVLEIGTSNGYSTIWLADAVQTTGGHVTTVEIKQERAAQAKENFRQAAVDTAIMSIVASAGDFLPSLNTASFDFIFLETALSTRIGGRSYTASYVLATSS